MKKIALNNLDLNQSNMLSSEEKKEILGGQLSWHYKCCLCGGCDSNISCGNHLDPGPNFCD